MLEKPEILIFAEEDFATSYIEAVETDEYKWDLEPKLTDTVRAEIQQNPDKYKAIIIDELYEDMVPELKQIYRGPIIEICSIFKKPIEGVTMVLGAGYDFGKRLKITLERLIN